MPRRLDVDGRLELAGPRGSRFEIVGLGDRVEVRSDRLRSLAGMSAFVESLRQRAGAGLAVVGARLPPAVTVVVRGQHIAQFDPPRVARLLRARHSIPRLATMLPAIRFGAIVKVAIRRTGPSSDPSDGQQSST